MLEVIIISTSILILELELVLELKTMFTQVPEL